MNRTIRVENLAHGTTSDDCELVFEDYGKILSCEIIPSKHPDSAAARIVYDSEDAALDAKESVDGARADGKILSVVLEKDIDGITEDRGSPLNSPSEPDLSVDSTSVDDTEAKKVDKVVDEPETPKEQPVPAAIPPPSSTLQADAPAFAPRTTSESPAPSSVADTALSSAIASDKRFSEEPELKSPKVVQQQNGWFTDTKEEDLEGFISAVLDSMEGLSKSGSDTSSNVSRPGKSLTIKKPQTAAPVVSAQKPPSMPAAKKLDPSTIGIKPSTSPILMKATAPTFVSTTKSPPFQPRSQTYQPASTYTQPLSFPNAGSMPFHPHPNSTGHIPVPSFPTTMVPYTGYNGYNPQASPFAPISGRSNLPPELTAYQAVLEKAEIFNLQDLQELLLNEKTKDKFVDDLAKEYPEDLKSFKLKFGLKVKLGQALGMD